MWYVKKFKAQTYCLFLEIILCFEKNFKISTILAVADLFTFVNKLWNDPLNLLRFLKYWTQMKGLTLSFLFCSCTFCFVQKHGLQIKIKIWFSEKIQLLQSALWRQSILNKKGPNIWVGQYWFLVFWFLSLGSKVMTKKLISRSDMRVKNKIDFFCHNFWSECQKWRNQKPILTYSIIGSFFI